MADRRYAVAFDGELIEGVTGIDVRGRLARICPSLSAAQIDALVGSRNVTLKLFTERDVADRFVGFMRQAGMVCWLRLIRPGEETATAMLADVDWSIEADARLAAATAPPSAPARRVSVPRAASGPKVMTAVIVLAVAAGAAAYFLRDDGPRKRRAIEPAAAALAEAAPAAPAAAAVSAPESMGAESAASAKAPTLQPQTKTLLVPEPILVSARAERAAPKEPSPQPAEAARLESPAPKAEPAAAPASPAVFAPAVRAQSVAMNRPAATSAPLPKAADVITAPTYDKARVPQPNYPVQAYRNRQEGEVLLNVLVGADGKAKKVAVDRTSGSAVLDRAAAEAVKGWQFTPGTRNGVPRDAAQQVTIGFKLDD